MKFYYIPLRQGESLTHRDWQINSEVRNSKRFEYDDYPTHRHSSSGAVYIMELIPEKRMNTIKYLNSHKASFRTIELEKGQYFRDAFGRYYMLEFEREHNTVEYQYYVRWHNV